MTTVQVPDRVANHDGVKRRLTGVWAAPARDAHILTIPRSGTSGVADILVALGDAGIGVSHVVSRADDSGAYELTVSGHPEDVVELLRAIGCRTARLHRDSALTPAHVSLQS